MFPKSLKSTFYKEKNHRSKKCGPNTESCDPAGGGKANSPELHDYSTEYLSNIMKYCAANLADVFSVYAERRICTNQGQTGGMRPKTSDGRYRSNR